MEKQVEMTYNCEHTMATATGSLPAFAPASVEEAALGAPKQ